MTDAPIRMTQITAVVLRAIAAGRRYGFDLMEDTGYPSGTVYPALRRLDKAGYLDSSWEDSAQAHAEGRPRRRVYRVTARGREALGEAEAAIARARRALDAVPGPEQEHAR